MNTKSCVALTITVLLIGLSQPVARAQRQVLTSDEVFGHYSPSNSTLQADKPPLNPGQPDGRGSGGGSHMPK